MMREKSGNDGVSYPEGGINQYIAAHIFNGQDAIHNLPTLE